MSWERLFPYGFGRLGNYITQLLDWIKAALNKGSDLVQLGAIMSMPFEPFLPFLDLGQDLVHIASSA